MTLSTLEARPSLSLSAWDLTELAGGGSPEAIESRFAELEAAVAAFETHRGALTSTIEPTTLLAILTDYESIIARTLVLDSYASLWFSSDTQSQAALSFQSHVQQALVATSNRILFFEIWWKGLSDEETARLLPARSTHADQRHFLLELRRSRLHTLDERSEQIIRLKDADGIEALMTLYSVLTNRLEFQLEIDGETLALTRDELASYVHSPRPEIRERAYRELYRVYGAEAAPLAEIYASRVRDWHNEHIKLRGFSTPIGVRSFANDIPDKAVDVLLETIRRQAPVFQRYFRLKARWLGLPKLRRFDLYAPLAEANQEITFADAARRVLDTFERFDPQFARLAYQVFEQRHVDSEVRKGKRGGAFCATVLPQQTPWVLVNFTGKLRDVTTLAHELGHALHSMLASSHSVLTQRSSLPLAETASVFAEMLVTERLLAEETSATARSELLLASIDNIYATVLRQAYFVFFEIAAHEAILAGRSPAELNEIYLANLAEQFGDSVELAPEFQHEWLSIPHLYQTPFYCYSYSFGQLLVLALYRRFQQEGPAFKPGYFKMLAYGGSARPQKILAEAGVDIEDPGFWSGGFDVIREMIDKLSRWIDDSPKFP